MKLDTSIWDNIGRLRHRIRNLASTVLSLSAFNSIVHLQNASWFMLALNILFFILTVPVFMSYSKWMKQPPLVLNEKPVNQ